MEAEPDTENLVFIDEYPHLAEKVRIRNLGRATVRQFQYPVVTEIIRPQPDPPEPAA